MIPEWNKLSEREIDAHKIIHSRLATKRNVFPCEGYESESYFVLKYLEESKKERWMLLRKDRLNVTASWSYILKIMRPLIGNRTFIEIYPRDEDIINTHPARWFWVLDNHPSELDLRNRSS